MGRNRVVLIEDELEQAVNTILTKLRLSGPNFTETPKRVAKFYLDLTNYPMPVIKTFPTNNKEMVVMKDHSVWGLCPHHLLPVHYTARVAYIPKGEALGLSKLARLVNYLVSTIPIQEDLTQTIVDHLDLLIKNIGVGCMITGQHLCMQMRGVKSCSTVTTTALKGAFLTDPSTKSEFLKS